ncbi:immunoglobulin i-set domain-containing protein [Phthorimaea operculella]|nr:immunoglobulin i-set domain-containing protein [Phthorimaea operculella]
MFARVSCVLFWISSIINSLGTCTAELQFPYLALYSPGDPEYTDVIVRRVGDNLNLTCTLKGDLNPRIYWWNYIPSDNTTASERPYKSDYTNRNAATSSSLVKEDLQISDSGHYVCTAIDVQSTHSAHTATKYILVQNKSNCARGALWCGHCVLGNYVCDGFNDCPHGEDEAPGLCLPRPDKLNCTSGRCISEAACCRPPSSLCKQPACCDEHPRYSRLEAGWAEEYPPLFEDRHAPDEYGFIQSTIYTVTACALIFMIAVVLLVSAICKMHMKRAALRSYTRRVDRLTPLQRDVRQMHRFPPCYEASRLLEAERNGQLPPAPTDDSTQGTAPSIPGSPLRDANQWRAECGEEEADGSTSGFRLARLSSLFNSRYRQVATECLDVELRAVRAASAASSPTRHPPLSHYRSPTSCDLNNEYFLHQEVSDCGRDLNFMATEYFRRNRETPRPLTLQLGRFQLSIPRLGRRRSSDRRPDTPNIAEINIDDLDFVRLNSNETYTLNGRTIRLLGADFENYPVLNDASVRPPPYNDSMRYKIYGPPPEYLSRDTLNNEREESTTVTEEQARRNIEMPPCYDELSGNNDSNGNNAITVVASVTDNATAENNTQNNVTSVTNNNINSATNNVSNVTNNNSTDNVTNNNVNPASLSAVIDDLPAIDDVNANGLDCGVAIEATSNVIATNNVTTNNNVANNNEC